MNIYTDKIILKQVYEISMENYLFYFRVSVKKYFNNPNCAAMVVKACSKQKKSPI